MRSDPSRASARPGDRGPAAHYASATRGKREKGKGKSTTRDSDVLRTRMKMVRCLRIALGSAYELQCHLEIASRISLIDANDLQAVIDQCVTTIKLVIGLLKKFHANVPQPS